jgi:hypothetical protein
MFAIAIAILAVAVWGVRQGADSSVGSVLWELNHLEGIQDT